MAAEQEPASADGAGAEHVQAPVQAGVELTELARAACLRLLAQGEIGRVVFTEGALPAAQPVTYLLDGEEIIFRTADASKLATATRNAVVGFQVDRLDTITRSGWSVLGVGHAYEVTATANSSATSSTAPGPGRGECARRIHDGSPRGLTPATRTTPRHSTPP